MTRISDPWNPVNAQVIRRERRNSRAVVAALAIAASLVALLIAHDAPAKVASVVIQAEQEAGL